MFLGIIFTFAAVIAQITAEPVILGSIVKLPTEFPYIVKLSIYFTAKNPNSDIKQKNMICVGVILTKAIVLTAAHCLQKPEMEITKIEVIAGTTDSNISTSSEQQRIVESYKVHEEFEKSKLNLMHIESLPNDIAILWLKLPFKVNQFVKPANFPTEVVNVTNVMGVFAGWGVTTSGFPSTNLRKVQLKGISWQDCLHKYNFPISRNTFCVLSLNGKCVPTIGDSGGPFIYNNEVLGLLSFGKRTTIDRVDGVKIFSCDPQKPLAFVDIFKYRNWIQRTIG